MLYWIVANADTPTTYLGGSSVVDVVIGKWMLIRCDGQDVDWQCGRLASGLKGGAEYFTSRAEAIAAITSASSSTDKQGALGYEEKKKSWLEECQSKVDSMLDSEFYSFIKQLSDMYGEFEGLPDTRDSEFPVKILKHRIYAMQQRRDEVLKCNVTPMVNPSLIPGFTNRFYRWYAEISDVHFVKWYQFFETENDAKEKLKEKLKEMLRV